MKLFYSTAKLQVQCTQFSEARKLFGGNQHLAIKLLSRINALESAETLNDVIHYPPLHFHNLHNKNGKNLEGYYAIDVGSHADAWRIILQPLQNDGLPYSAGSIDAIAKNVRIILIREVSHHYE